LKPELLACFVRRSRSCRFASRAHTLAVEKPYATTHPPSSFSFTGNVNGMPFTMSTGFTGVTPTRVIDLAHLIAGRVLP
jgi:hypothetical protein